MIKEQKLDLFRYIANVGLWAGQMLLLYVDVETGIVFKLISAAVIAISLVKYKMWDMVATLTAFSILDASRLFFGG